MMPMEAIPTHRTNLDASGVTAAPAPDIIPEHVRHLLVATLPAGPAAGKSAEAGPRTVRTAEGRFCHWNSQSEREALR